MPLITDQQVISFANNRIRPLANQLLALKVQIEQANLDWIAQGLASQITASGSANAVNDGADIDGRPVITGDDMVVFAKTLDDFQNVFLPAVAGRLNNISRIHTGD